MNISNSRAPSTKISVCVCVCVCVFVISSLDQSQIFLISPQIPTVKLCIPTGGSYTEINRIDCDELN